MIRVAANDKAAQEAMKRITQSYINVGYGDRLKEQQHQNPIFPLQLILNYKGEKEVRDQLTEIVRESLSEPGFDSWSDALLDVDYMALLAEKRGAKDLAAEIRVTKESLGFRCR